VGNFTGEADYLYQREVVAANPKIYAQLVKILAPYSRVIKDDEAAEEGSDDADGNDAAAAMKALADSASPAAAEAAAQAAPPARKAVRIRKPVAASTGEAKGEDAPF
jgi:myo-inositol-1(or 4)-monophosphatase